MKIRLLVFLCSLLFLTETVKSAYFSFLPYKVLQPDGSEINCFASGDEFYSWLHDSGGYTIIQAADGYYYYGIAENGLVKPTLWKVNQADPVIAGLKPWAKISLKEYRKRKESFLPREAGSVLTPHTGTLNNLVIYIRFADDPEFINSRQYFDEKFNNASGVSLKSYYNEVSYTQLAINSSHYPACPVTTNLSYQDSHPRSYFQPYNATTNPGGYLEGADRTIREHTLLRDAINWINSQSPVPPNLVIDSDSDGFADNICFIIKGSSSGWSSLLWAHSWSLFTYEVLINGKKVSRYTFHPETQTEVSTLCHEMFHSLGAPDLYHYVNTSLQPVQSWDLMDQGFGHMGAYMKWKYSNHSWVDSIPQITATGTYSLNPLSSASGNCFKVRSVFNENEFFVLEYRQKAGMYESKVPGSGLLIYRINPVFGGNSEGPPDEVYVYRPGGTVSLNGDPSNAYYAAETGRTALNDTTAPPGFLTSGLPGGLMISNISTAGSSISFTVTVSNTQPVSVFSANPMATDMIYLNWTKNQASDHVLLAGGISPVTGNPGMGIAYSPGDTLPGGSIVLYEGPASQFTHSGLNPSTRYYYRIWSGDPDHLYSASVDTVATTLCSTFGFPFSEDFSASHMPDCWSSLPVNDDEAWVLSTTNGAGGNFNELRFFSFMNPQGYSQVILPPFNTQGITKLNLSFRFLMNDFASGATVRVRTSSDRLNWTDEEWVKSSSPNPDNIPEYVQTTVNHNLDSPVTYVAITVQGLLYAAGYLYFDDFEMSIAECNFFSVQATASPASGGSISGSGYYYPGQVANLTAVPNAQWNFLYWSENGSPVSYQPAYSFMVEGNRSLTAVFSKTQVSILADASPSEAGIASGTGIYSLYDPVDLVAVPAPGFDFWGWMEEGSVIATSAEYSFSALRCRRLTATFVIHQVNLQLTAWPAGAGTFQGGGTYSSGTEVSIIAVPDPGYQFVGWFENGVMVSSFAEYSFTIMDDHNLEARFYCPVCNVTVAAEPEAAGTVSGGGGYASGEEATVVATANEGWIFRDWKESGTMVSDHNTFSFVVDQEHNLVAGFKKLFTVNAVISPLNSGTVIGAGNHPDGTTCTLMALPNEGFEFRYWSEAGDSISSSNVLQFRVEGNRDLQANFRETIGVKPYETLQCRLYPNPTTGLVCIDLSPLASFHPGKIEVIDRTGRSVSVFKIHEGKGAQVLSLANLPDGLYAFVISNKEQQLLSLKVMLAR